MERRQTTGFAVALTLVGAILGHLILLPGSDVLRITRRDQRGIEAASTMEGALIGAVLGVALDFAFNGKPKKRDWQFGLKTLMFAVVALAILSIAVQSLVETLSP